MAGLNVKFTPLYGASGSGPLSCLLQLNDFTILLDCGWGDPYDVAALEPLLDVLKTVDAVLISHPDPHHLGALPRLVGVLGLKAPVYATGAVHKMGQMFMYNAYITRHGAGDFPAFDLDNVDAAFERITQLRYRQETALTGKGAGIAITPLPAGRLLGGTVWRVTTGGEDFVYAVGFNHRRERHLAGAPLDSAFLRPALMIADAASSTRPPSDRQRNEQALLDACVASLRADGNVLVPVDAAGRLLELILLFEHHWTEHRLPYPLALVGPMARTTLEFARSTLEWMNEALVKSFGHSKDNPFTLKFFKVCASLADLKKLPDGPKVVLATDPSLLAGPARHLFADWAGDARNAVVFALEPEEGSLAAGVLVAATERDAAPPGTPLPTLQFTLSRRVALKGEELTQYLDEQEKRREEEEAARAEAAGGGDMDLDIHNINMEMDGITAPSPGEGAQVPTRANVATIGHAGREAIEARGDGAAGTLAEESDIEEGAGNCLVEGFEVPEGAVAPMYPAEDEWEGIAYDEYGSTIEYGDFEASGDVVGGRLGRALASEAAAERGPEDGGEEGGTAAVAEIEIPTKIETREQVVELAARVLRIDFDGVSDGRSVQTMLAHVAPRNALLIHGGDEAKAALANRLQRELEGLHATVFIPGEGEPMEIAVGPSFEVALSDKLARAADLHAVSGYELAWVNSVVGPPQDGIEAQEGLEAGASGSEAQQHRAPTLLPPPAGRDVDDGAAYGGVFIGDVRLSELKRALAAVGVASQFHSGALYCAGQVVVKRRGEGGGLVLEGALGDAYYKVRDVVYGQYHVC